MKIGILAPEGEVQGEKVEVVDVTDLLVERFHPDEATRKLLAEVRKYPKGVRVDGSRRRICEVDGPWRFGPAPRERPAGRARATPGSREG